MKMTPTDFTNTQNSVYLNTRKWTRAQKSTAPRDVKRTEMPVNTKPRKQGDQKHEGLQLPDAWRQ